jgi:hypothetical protein
MNLAQRTLSKVPHKPLERDNVAKGFQLDADEYSVIILVYTDGSAFAVRKDFNSSTEYMLAAETLEDALLASINDSLFQEKIH